jgi:hypothetical protein
MEWVGQANHCLCCRIAGWPNIPSIGWKGGRENPAKPKPVVAANGLLGA